MRCPHELPAHAAARRALAEVDGKNEFELCEPDHAGPEKTATCMRMSRVSQSACGDEESMAI